LKITLSPPWYSWKIAELALNHNHSLNTSMEYFNVSGAPDVCPIKWLIGIIDENQHEMCFGK
jgi:hypothetical protein